MTPHAFSIYPPVGFAPFVSVVPVRDMSWLVEATRGFEDSGYSGARPAVIRLYRPTIWSLVFGATGFLLNRLWRDA